MQSCHRITHMPTTTSKPWLSTLLTPRLTLKIAIGWELFGGILFNMDVFPQDTGLFFVRVQWCLWNVLDCQVCLSILGSRSLLCRSSWSFFCFLFLGRGGFWIFFLLSFSLFKYMNIWIKVTWLNIQKKKKKKRRRISTKKGGKILWIPVLKDTFYSTFTVFGSSTAYVNKLV